MNPVQKHLIFVLYCRDKHSFPRGGLKLFPDIQRAGTESDPVLNSMEELEAFCKFNKDVFINLFSDDQKRSKTYDMIFLDIDADDVVEASKRCVKVLEALTVNGINKYYIAFSGSKGYHIYVPFEDTLLSDYRAAVLGWIKKIGIIEYVDISAIEPNRVTRVPLTVNSKSKMKCCPLGSWILESAKGVNDGLGKKIKGFDKTPRIKKIIDGRPRLKQKSEFFSEPQYYPECMKILTEEALNGTDLGHFERLEMGIFLLHVHGNNIEEAMRYYSTMSDYKPKVTGYQLNYILKKGLKMMGCDKLRDYGMCPFSTAEEAESKCPFYPNLNKFIDKENKR